MNRKLGERFEYSAPANWTETRDGDRWVYHGPDTEELIVSGFFITQATSTNSPEEIEGALLANALEAARYAVEDSQLRILKSLDREDGSALCQPGR